MRRSAATTTAVLAAMVWLACGEKAADPGLDASFPEDAGQAGADAATAGPDAAAPGLDAATPGPDAAAPGPDAAAPGPDAAAPLLPPTRWTTVQMPQARANFTMSAMSSSGTVLVAGGEVTAGVGRTPLSATAYFWPSNGSFTRGPNLPEARANHTAEVLSDGNILLVGGGVSTDQGQPAGGTSALASALLFDPSTAKFTATGSLAAPRSHHASVRLLDGRVLVVGGGGAAVDGQTKVALALATAEIYDPTLGTWSAAASLKVPRFLPRATLLADGRVLVTGGGNQAWQTIAEPEIYDPTSNTWKTAALPAGGGRIYHGAVRLSSGNVLVACGMNWTPSNGWRSDAEFYDPAKDKWFPAGETGSPRSAPAVVGIGEKVLVTGGQYRSGNSFPFSEDTHVYDEATGEWTPGPAIGTPRSLGSVLLLKNGQVLACGGFSESGVESTCELGSR